MKFLKKSFPVLVFVTVVLAVSCSNNSSKSSSSDSGSGSGSSSEPTVLTRYEAGTSLRNYTKIYSYTYQGPITDANGTHNVTRTYRIGIGHSGLTRCVVSEGVERWRLLEGQQQNTGPDGGNLYFVAYDFDNLSAGNYVTDNLTATTDGVSVNLKFSHAEAKKFMCDSYSVYENPYDTSSRRIAYFPGIAQSNLPATVVFNRE